MTLNGEIAPQFTNFSLIDQMNQQLDSRADYYGSPLPRVAIAPSHTAPSQWRSSFLVDCTVEICLLLPIFAHLILNDPLRNARGNRGNRHFLTRPAREFFYHESPSIISTEYECPYQIEVHDVTAILGPVHVVQVPGEYHSKYTLIIYFTG